MRYQTRKDLVDDLDRFESMFAHLSEGDGDEADELANVAAFWLDYFQTNQDLKAVSDHPRISLGNGERTCCLDPNCPVWGDEFL